MPEEALISFIVFDAYRQFTGQAPLIDEVDNIMALASNCNIKTHTDIFQKIDAVYDTVVNI